MYPFLSSSWAQVLIQAPIEHFPNTFVISWYISKRQVPKNVNKQRETI